MGKSKVYWGKRKEWEKKKGKMVERGKTKKWEENEKWKKRDKGEIGKREQKKNRRSAWKGKRRGWNKGKLEKKGKRQRRITWENVQIRLQYIKTRTRKKTSDGCGAKSYLPTWKIAGLPRSLQLEGELSRSPLLCCAPKFQWPAQLIQVQRRRRLRLTSQPESRLSPAPRLPWPVPALAARWSKVGVMQHVQGRFLGVEAMSFRVFHLCFSVLEFYPLNDFSVPSFSPIFSFYDVFSCFPFSFRAFSQSPLFSRALFFYHFPHFSLFSCSHIFSYLFIFHHSRLCLIISSLIYKHGSTVPRGSSCREYRWAVRDRLYPIWTP